MLDLEPITPPTHDGLNIVSLAEMKEHLRLPAAFTDEDDFIRDAILDAAEILHGMDGELNRTVFPMTWRRYLRRFPSDGLILLPYPPTIALVNVGIGSSLVDINDYSLVRVDQVWGVEFRPRYRAPRFDAGPRAMSVTFTAGYQQYPRALCRAVKMMAAHFYENRETTTVDPRITANSRKLEFGHNYLTKRFVVGVAYDQWE